MHCPTGPGASSNCRDWHHSIKGNIFGSLAEISLEFFSRKVDQLITESREIKQQNLSILDGQVTLGRNFLRLERTIADLRDDLASMIRMEIGGATAHSRTMLEHRVDADMAAVWDVLIGAFGVGDDAPETFEQFVAYGRKRLEERIRQDVS